MRDWFAQFRGLDINDIGTWPGSAKALVLVAGFCLALGAGHALYLSGKQDAVNTRMASETELKREYQRKSLPAAGLDAARARHRGLATEFETLLRQLPRDTEVPGLIEDISRAAITNGLTVEGIDLEDERATGFYMELPIRITVSGHYHHIGTFVSDVAALSRIVTFHDFEIAPEGKSDQLEALTPSHCEVGAPEDCSSTDGSRLSMAILAKTYSYLSLPVAVTTGDRP
ncbi:MAG: type 4a pilus biogenesis protein PilO [Gammaproteobacteria bacterium]|nr:type 4a pilus biogenesis protein PilO [Gammaproteobacteria bacterium]